MTLASYMVESSTADSAGDAVLPHKNTTLPIDSDQVALQTAWAVIDIILFLVITTGNVLTITAILRRPLVVSNLLVLSLACSDLSVGLMTPYHMAFYLDRRLESDFRHCIVRLSLVVLACVASMFNILAIAADRFLAIVFPLHYHEIMTHRRAYAIIGCVWLGALTIATAPAYWNRWPAKCQLGLVVHPLYIYLCYVPLFILLFCTMCAVYAKIICEAWRHAERYPPARWKSVQVLMLVMGSFTLSYTPFFVVNVLSGLYGEEWSSSIIYKLTNSLGMANSAINPIIYTWKNQEFKEEITRLVTCKGCKSEESGQDPGGGPRIYTTSTM